MSSLSNRASSAFPPAAVLAVPLALVCATASPALAQRRAAAATPPATPITVGANVHVSTARAGDPHFELLAAADPANPDRLLACSMVFGKPIGRMRSVVYGSFDGGRTWAPTLDRKELELTGDPVCTYGPDGVAYYVALSLPDLELQRRTANTLVFRSSDGGRTWAHPESTAFLDREFAIVDHTTGPRRGTLYINGTHGARSMHDPRSPSAIGLVRSRDGRHFEGPTVRLATGRRYILGMGNSVILSDGTLVMVTMVIRDFYDTERADDTSGDIAAPAPGKPNATLEIVTSDDGGAKISAATRIADVHMPSPYTGTSINPYLAIDASDGPFRDRIYAVWPDQRSGRTEIHVAWSSDKGKTWSSPQVVNDDRAPADPKDARDHLMPVIAVNGAGVVGVSWYDRRDNPDRLGWYVRFTASLDGGETWLPSVRVSERPASFESLDRVAIGASARGGGTPNPEPGAPPPPAGSGGNPIAIDVSINGFSYQGGHYSGMVADAAGLFRPMWVDNRTGVSQIWTAPVRVAGAAARHGGGDLAALEDHSARVTLELTDQAFDHRSGTVTLRGRLKNSSTDTLRTPLRVRLTELHSGLGIPSIVGADNGVTGPGAVLDFTPLVRGGALLPQDTTASRVLTFRLADLRPPTAGPYMPLGVLSVQARVLAPALPARDSTARREPR